MAALFSVMFVAGFAERWMVSAETRTGKRMRSKVIITVAYVCCFIVCLLFFCSLIIL